MCIRDRGKVELTAQMIRIVFPYLLFVSLVSLAGGVLNVFRQFAIPAFTPVLLNLSIIGAALFLAPYCEPPVVALAWGVFIGGVAQRGELPGQPFQGAHQLEKMAHVVDRQHGDRGAAIGVQFDQAFGGQHLERLAQRCARDLEFGAQHPFVQTRTRGKTPFGDPFPQPVGDLFVQRTAGDRPRRCRRCRLAGHDRGNIDGEIG